jgi:hypothetical protein
VVGLPIQCRHALQITTTPGRANPNRRTRLARRANNPGLEGAAEQLDPALKGESARPGELDGPVVLFHLKEPREDLDRVRVADASTTQKEND